MLPTGGVGGQGRVPPTRILLFSENRSAIDRQLNALDRRVCQKILDRIGESDRSVLRGGVLDDEDSVILRNASVDLETFRRCEDVWLGPALAHHPLYGSLHPGFT
jgi:hypothetical protein